MYTHHPDSTVNVGFFLCPCIVPASVPASTLVRWFTSKYLATSVHSTPQLFTTHVANQLSSCSFQVKLADSAMPERSVCHLIRFSQGAHPPYTAGPIAMEVTVTRTDPSSRSRLTLTLTPGKRLFWVRDVFTSRALNPRSGVTRSEPFLYHFHGCPFPRHSRACPGLPGLRGGWASQCYQVPSSVRVVSQERVDALHMMPGRCSVRRTKHPPPASAASSGPCARRQAAPG